MTGAAVPPALAAFSRIVGTIDLVPGRPGAAFPPGVPEQLAFADPLQVIDLATAWFSVEEWQDESAEVHPEIAGPVEVMISADYLHKADVSGGAPYSAWLPDPGADPLVRDEEHHLTFADYLRHAFACKGFLRLDRRDEWLADSGTPGSGAEVDGWLRSVAYEHAGF